jgi:hypothetical protein
MFDAFPFDEWSEEITTFWTFGVENDTGTYILTILGVLLMIGSLVQFVRMESKKLDTQTAALRRAMAAADQASAPTPTTPTS